MQRESLEGSQLGDIAAGEFLREVFEGRRKNNLLLLRYSVSWSFRVQCCRDPVIVMSIESVGYCSDLTDSPAVLCVQSLPLSLSIAISLAFFFYITVFFFF